MKERTNNESAFKKNEYQNMQEKEAYQNKEHEGEILNTERSEKYNLFWVCSQTGRKIPAGVAFFNESQGDYRLKIDALCDDKLVFLKITSMNDGVIRYRVESVAWKSGPPSRVEIGRGHSSENGCYPVYMELGPFSKTLIMDKAA